MVQQHAWVGLWGSLYPARVIVISGWLIASPERCGWVEVVADGEQLWVEVGDAKMETA